MSAQKVDLDETLELETSFDLDRDDDDNDVSTHTPTPVYHLVVKEEGNESKLPLIPGLNRIGRDERRCGVVLRSPSVSALHAVIFVKVSWGCA